MILAYGMTEMTTCTHASNLGSTKNVGGTVGIPAPNVECKVLFLSFKYSKIDCGPKYGQSL